MTGTKVEHATLGGGCFWCLEAVYEQIEGVTEVVSGYAGGEVAEPTYAQVCTGRTGHAEVVRLSFDPGRIGFRDLLDIFFTIHDPTTRDRQGADIGTQYRSVIFYHDEEQRRIAEETIAERDREGVWDDPIVTQLEPAPAFYPAEPEHIGYYGRNPNQPYCQVVIAPKLAKLRKAHFERLRRMSGEPQSEGAGEVRPYQTQPHNPIDHGGIAE